MAIRYVTAAAAGFGDGTIGNPWTLTQANAGATASTDVVYVQEGTYTGAFIFTNAGLRWMGRNSDWSQPTEPVAVFDAALGFVQPFSSNVEASTFEFITFKRSTGTGNLFVVGSSGHHNRFARCRFSTSGGALISHSAADGLTCIGCEFDTWGTASTTAAVVTSGGIAPVFANNNFHDGTGRGLDMTGSLSGGVISRNIFDTMTGIAVTLSSTTTRRPLLLVNNTFYDCTSGLTWTSTAFQPVLSMGNVFHTISGSAFAYGGSNSPKLWSISDKFFNVAVTVDANIVNETPWADSFVVFIDDPFRDAAGGDFRLTVADTTLKDFLEPRFYLLNGAVAPWRGYLDIGAVDSGEYTIPADTYPFRHEVSRHYA